MSNSNRTHFHLCDILQKAWPLNFDVGRYLASSLQRLVSNRQVCANAPPFPRHSSLTQHGGSSGTLFVVLLRCLRFSWLGIPSNRLMRPALLRPLMRVFAVLSICFAFCFRSLRVARSKNSRLLGKFSPAGLRYTSRLKYHGFFSWDLMALSLMYQPSTHGRTGTHTGKLLLL